MRRSGRVRGRPRPPGRGTRMPANTGSNWVLSCRCPGVITIESGRPCRRRPGGTWSSGPPDCARALRRPDGGPPFRIGPTGPTPSATRMLVGARGGAIYAHFPDDLPHRIRLRLRVGQNPVPGSIAPPAVQPVSAGLPWSVALWKVPPRRARPQLPQDAIDHRAVVAPLAASPPRSAARVARWRSRPPRSTRRVQPSCSPILCLVQNEGNTSVDSSDRP